MNVRLRRPKLVTAVLAILLVFLMSTGAFVGAVDENLPDSTESVRETSILSDAGVSDIKELDENDKVKDGLSKPETLTKEENLNFVKEQPKEDDYSMEVDLDEAPGFNDDVEQHMVTMSKPSGEVITTSIQNLNQPEDLTIGIEDNSFSDAMSYMVPANSIREDVSNSKDMDSSRAPIMKKSILLGADNPNQAGAASGYIYKSGTSYTVYDQYYMYNYRSSSNIYRGFTVFDLSDLEDYSGTSIMSGYIRVRNYQRNYALTNDFYALKTVPKDGDTGTTAQQIFNEAGGTGTVKIASYSTSVEVDTNYNDVYIPLTTKAISDLNSRLSVSNYAYAIGSNIAVNSSSSTYARWYIYDIRIMLNFSYFSDPTTSNEVAVGDELAGYVRSTTKYDFGRIYSSSTSYRGFTVWDIENIREIVPSKGLGGENVSIQRIALRVNSPFGYLESMGIYQMKDDPRTANAATIYADAADGTQYVYFPTGATSSLTEFEWDLGPKALEDFSNSFEDGNPGFFALGFSRTTSYLYLYSAKLVVYYELAEPESKTITFGPQNPQYPGHAQGYLYGYSTSSSTTYYGYAMHYSYFKYSTSSSSTFDYRGFMVYDLTQLQQWENVKVLSGYIIARNYNRQYAMEMEFYAMKNIPFDGATNSEAGTLFNEAGGMGTIKLGTFSASTTTDSTQHDIIIPLDSNGGITEINNRLSAKKAKTFPLAIGGKVTKLASGTTGGMAYWRDIRLVLTFTYSDEPDSGPKGPGIEFGDSISGAVYKYTTTINYPDGRMYVRTQSTNGEYRGYCQWDVSDIRGGLPDLEIVITSLKLQINNDYGVTNLDIYNMQNNVSSSSPEALFADCGDGTTYATGVSTNDRDVNLEINLGKQAVKEFQGAIEDNDPDFFGLGIVSTTSYSYLYGPKLLIGWKEKPPTVNAFAGGPYFGNENDVITFNANQSWNISKGTGNLKYEWDWDFDGLFDEITTSPYVDHTWEDDFDGTVTLKVTDTTTGTWAMDNATVSIANIPPVIKSTSGAITPQPVMEANNITFQNFEFSDPGKDTWWYFWDFDSDGEFDASGIAGNDRMIPAEVVFFDDDYIGEAILVVVDDDGGSSNITIEKKISVSPATGETGYAVDTGYSYINNYVYVEWQYSTDYRRGWAKFDLSNIPNDAIIESVKFIGSVAYNDSVNRVGVRKLTTDPLTTLDSSGITTFNEAGTGTRLFGLNWNTGLQELDLGSTGVNLIQSGLKDGFVALGFDFEAPTTFGRYYGYMYGYSTSPMTLEIKYTLMKPGCMVPFVVNNVPPKIDEKQLIMTPTTVNEGEIITLNGLTFFDPGNDTYEYNVEIGDSFETGWISLGGPGLGAGVPIFKNPGFESGATDWKYSEKFSYDYYFGAVDTSWKTEGSNSYHLYAKPNTVTKQGDYCMIEQEVDLTNIESLMFDVKTGELFEAYSWGTTWSYDFIAEALIDNTRVWATSKEYSVLPDVKIDVSTYTGKHTFKFRLFERENGTNIGGHTFDVFIDNLRAYGPSFGNGWGVYGPGSHSNSIPINVTIPDDYPSAGTSWDDITITVYVRDDDDNKLIPGTGIPAVTGPQTIQSNGVYSSSLAFNSGRKLVVDSEYNIYTVYYAQLAGDTSYQIYLAKSMDAGNTWEHFKISDQWYFKTSYQYYPSIAIDSEDVLHVVWHGGTSVVSAYNIYYARSDDGGTTWEHFNVTSYTSYSRYYPSITVDSDDTVHVVWYGMHSSSYCYNIYYRSRSSGGSWDTETMVTTHPYSSPYLYQYRPSVEVDSNNNVHVVWYGYFNQSLTYYNIQYAKKSSSTGNWSTPIALTTDTTYHTGPTLTVDSNDNVHVVWYGRDNIASGSYNIMYMMYDASTSTWGAKEYITSYTSSVYQYYPTIAVNKNGVIDVLWEGYSMPGGTSPYIIRHSQKTSSGWSTDENYNAGEGSYQYYPSLLGHVINSKANSGFAYVWVDSDKIKFDTSDDLEIGKPLFTDGIDWVDRSLVVNNVAPEINTTAIDGKVVYEQTDFDLLILFDDPALLAETEQFEYKINWGDGTLIDWTSAPVHTTDELLAGRNPKEGYAYGTSIEDTYSFNDQPINRMWAKFFSADSDTYDIRIEGFNKNSLAWELIYSHYDFSDPGEFEMTFATPIFTSWRIVFADYENNDNIYYEYAFEVENFEYEGFGYLTASYLYNDDMPTLSPEDNYNLIIELRDDDLGTDKVNINLIVRNIPPDINNGIVTPELSYGIDEGTMVNLKYFTFDDVAFDEFSEDFEYEVDWGDGTINGGWSTDFEMAGIGGEVFTVESDVMSSAATNYNNGRKLVMDSVGNLYTVMTHRPSTSSYYQQVFIAVSGDYGETWTEYGITTADPQFASNYQYYPSIAIDSQGVLHVVWQGATSTNTQSSLWYANSTDNGKTWANFSLVQAGEYFYSYPVYRYIYHYEPSIAVDSNDVIHITWRFYNYSYDYSTSKNNYENAIKYINNAGGLWGTPFNLIFNSSDTSPLYFYRPSLAIDNSNNIHTVWYGYTEWSITNNIFYRKFDSSTTTWDELLLLTNETGGYYYQAESPQVTTDISGNVHIVYSQRYQTWWNYIPNIRYVMFDATTNSWEEPVNITDDSSNYQYFPTIGTDERGYVYIAWYGGSTYSIKLRVKDESGKFAPEMDITSDSEFSSQYYPHVIGHGPNCHPERGTGIVWTGYISGKYDVMFYGTKDFFLGFGPLKGLPEYSHFYRDDNPTSTDKDNYEITIRVRDDDMGVGEYVIPFEIRNVPPIILSNITIIEGNENEIILPPVKFKDQGTNYQVPYEFTEPIFVDGFESGTLSEWSTGVGWYVGTSDPHNGTYRVAAQSDTTDSTMTTKKTFNLTNHQNMILSFYSYTYDTESNDYFYVDVSDNGGSTWTNVAKWNGVELRTGYYNKYEINLSAYNGVDEFKFRFRFTASNWYEWWHIDDVNLSGQSIGLQGGNEIWDFWWDLNNNGVKDSADIIGDVENVQVIDNVTYGITPELKAIYNDDYSGKATLFIYDDDINNEMLYTQPLFLPGYQVTNAIFEVYQWSNVWEEIDWTKVGYAGGSTTYCEDMSVYQNLAPWNETTVKWSNYAPSSTNMKFTPEDTMTLAQRRPFLGAEYPTGGQAHWEFFDVSDLTYEWLEGKASNYGLSIMPTMMNNTLVAWEHTVYYSSDHTTSYDTYKPKLTIDVDTDNNGFPDAQYVLQPSNGKDAWIAQSLINNATRESGSDLYLIPNIYNATLGYSSIGSYYRRGLVEFDLSSVSWRAENSVIWENPTFNLTVDVIVHNSNPELITSMQTYHLQGDLIEFDITISDPGSDDLNFTYDFGDGSLPIMGGYYYNDGIAPDAKGSCFSGIAPFQLHPEISHIYYDPGEYRVNFSINDDDGGHANETILIKIPTAKELKEEAVRILEPLVPGRWDYIGYKNLTLRYRGYDNMTVLAYNHISRMPYYDEMKLIYSFCDVDDNETIFVDASLLSEGMFGEELILKIYYANRTFLDEVTIPTVYSCLNQLEPGQRYGAFEIVDIGKKNGTTYHHYSKFALEVENAMDNILFSLNKDPRRGYGWWHTHWVWYCGYWIQRELWLGNSSIDPQFGTIVFCEELYAIQHLMTVINNCLKCDGVHNLTFRWTGPQKVDIEVYSYGVWWNWWNNWEHTHTFHDISPGDEMFIGSSGYPLCGKLAERTMIKVYKYNTGELLDAVYIRTSGLWPLEVEPGNIYGLIEITAATLKLGCGNFWREWFGDYNAFDYMDWQVSRCGWEKEDCYDEQVAAEEEARICSNLSAIKSAIDLLVMADDLIARVAYWDAENMTAINASNQDEYDFHIKMAKRYMLRARREAGMGRPHRAIRDFKLSWQNSILASKWVILNFADENGTTDPAENHPNPDFDCDCFCYMENEGKQGLWWLWWYMKYQVKLKKLFHTFPDWRDYTDPEVWGGNQGGGEDGGSGTQGGIMRTERRGWYIGYEDYYSDYDYNDWAMEMHETRYVNDCSKGISKIHIEFIADANEAGYKHYIHLRIGIENHVKYKWTVNYYNHEDQLIDTKNSNGYVSGEFDQIIFDTAEFPFKHEIDPYKTVVDLKFEREIRTIDIDKGPYDPYMHVRTTGKIIHTYTTRPTTKTEAKGSSPSLADKYVPMLLVIDDVDFEPPKDGIRIWTVYEKFDDWIIAGYPTNVKWWV